VTEGGFERNPGGSFLGASSFLGSCQEGPSGRGTPSWSRSAVRRRGLCTSLASVGAFSLAAVSIMGRLPHVIHDAQHASRVTCDTRWPRRRQTRRAGA
jgi:hypothetical protein